MTKVVVGKKVPDFKLPATGGNEIGLSDFKGSKLVIYFYPRDNTPGCTKESNDFKSKVRSFAEHNIKIVGVSRDSVSSHEKFKDKYKFPFDLLSDDEEKLCTLFDVIKQKSMFGKKVRGIQRSTFLIDEKGVLRQEWRKVKVSNHVNEVLEAALNI